MEPHINYLWLIKSYEENVIHRILMPNEHNNIHIIKSYVTADDDLFVVCETEDGYNLYYINLDDYTDDKNKTGQVFFPQLMTDYYPSYKKSDVNFKNLYEF